MVYSGFDLKQDIILCQNVNKWLHGTVNFSYSEIPISEETRFCILNHRDNTCVDYKEMSNVIVEAVEGVVYLTFECKGVKLSWDSKDIEIVNFNDDIIEWG